MNKWRSAALGAIVGFTSLSVYKLGWGGLLLGVAFTLYGAFCYQAGRRGK